MKPYTIVIEGKPQGPFSREELLQLRITPETFVKTGGMDDYKEAQEIAELRELLGFKKSYTTPQYFATLDSRLLAIAIDYFLIFGIYAVLTLLAFFVVEARVLKIAIALAGLAIIPIARTIYAIFTEAGPAQATLGKRLLGLKVCDEQGMRLAFSRSLLRNLMKWLSTFSLGIGYLYGFFDKKQQCLHDKLARTMVVKDRLL